MTADARPVRRTRLPAEPARVRSRSARRRRPGHRDRRGAGAVPGLGAAPLPVRLRAHRDHRGRGRAPRCRSARSRARMGRSARGHRRGAHPDRRPRARALRDPRDHAAHRVPVPRQAGHEGGAARRRHPLRPVDRRDVRRGGACLRGRGGLPAHPQAAGRRRRGRHLSCGERRRARAGHRHHPGRSRVPDRRRGVRRGARGLLRHPVHRGAGRARLRVALLPERARGDAHALDLSPDHRDQPLGRRHLRRGEGNGAQGHRRARTSARPPRTWSGSSAPRG